jgi:hypothetical protein
MHTQYKICRFREKSYFKIIQSRLKTQEKLLADSSPSEAMIYKDKPRIYPCLCYKPIGELFNHSFAKCPRGELKEFLCDRLIL